MMRHDADCYAGSITLRTEAAEAVPPGGAEQPTAGGRLAAPSR